MTPNSNPTPADESWINQATVPPLLLIMRWERERLDALIHILNTNQIRDEHGRRLSFEVNEVGERVEYGERDVMLKVHVVAETPEEEKS